MAIEYNYLTLQDFRDHGYNIYLTKNASRLEADWAYYLVQKKIYIDGEKHFINIYITEYDREPWKDFKGFNPSQSKAYTIKLQYSTEKNTFNLDILPGSVYDIPEIEDNYIKWFKFIKEVEQGSYYAFI